MLWMRICDLFLEKQEDESICTDYHVRSLEFLLEKGYINTVNRSNCIEITINGKIDKDNDLIFCIKGDLHG